jgi:hypothetical protein
MVKIMIEKGSYGMRKKGRRYQGGLLNGKIASLCQPVLLC